MTHCLRIVLKYTNHQFNHNQQLKEIIYTEKPTTKKQIKLEIGEEDWGVWERLRMEVDDSGACTCGGLRNGGWFCSDLLHFIIS
jgi:hypothetical protein